MGISGSSNVSSTDQGCITQQMTVPSTWRLLDVIWSSSTTGYWYWTLPSRLSAHQNKEGVGLQQYMLQLLCQETDMMNSINRHGTIYLAIKTLVLSTSVIYSRASRRTTLLQQECISVLQPTHRWGGTKSHFYISSTSFIYLCHQPELATHQGETYVQLYV